MSAVAGGMVARLCKAMGGKTCGRIQYSQRRIDFGVPRHNMQGASSQAHRHGYEMINCANLIVHASNLGKLER